MDARLFLKEAALLLLKRKAGGYVLATPLLD